MWCTLLQNLWSTDISQTALLKKLCPTPTHNIPHLCLVQVTVLAIQATKSAELISIDHRYRPQTQPSQPDVLDTPGMYAVWHGGCSSACKHSASQVDCRARADDCWQSLNRSTVSATHTQNTVRHQGQLVILYMCTLSLLQWFNIKQTIN